MSSFADFKALLALLPGGLMFIPAIVAVLQPSLPAKRFWTLVQRLCMLAAALSLVSLGLRFVTPAPAGEVDLAILPGLTAGLVGAWFGALVQCLGAVIAGFSSRYLDGERGQVSYAAALSAVLATVQLLTLADNWIVLIAAWAATGFALNRLLCFYADRPFAVLAAHKKFLADRLADVCLIAAAWLADRATGSFSISTLLHHAAVDGVNPDLQLCALLLALAVAIRTAMLPVHGWLIQVMEAPTPVSALLHAGVVNLGGFVVIRFAPLFDASAPAHALLAVAGLASAVLAGFVSLTRISIKVRLAWSTLAQMGFMLLECGVGLYHMAALHLIGHSLYKAHAFLSSGAAVRQARLNAMRQPWQPAVWSLVLAPVLGIVVSISLAPVLALIAPPLVMHDWPVWWSMILALAWAPMLWVPAAGMTYSTGAQRILLGGLLFACLLVLSFAGHTITLGAPSAPHALLGQMACAGMAMLYTGTAVMQVPRGRQWLEPWRRSSYAGFYLDEAYTRLALHLWPAQLPASTKSPKNQLGIKPGSALPKSRAG
ncbi:NADH-quinone oxidoreductase subunit L [Pandoraea sp.]|uniref:NADH-quinone oxidoreductase subunit L n=1 Tax=Pandoraea sp. TaxID=1883445 RepID=UPI0012127FF2|nr:NADH-quinone oxidoreductase subunit L [Pandoraea sp.]TAL55568.1 MAG: NADH-quinone oxidoreductase subunit L [Pandoraea sp.]TAM20103.1 MAG: NADH-quinone oxidoreductase subunit L [Pandoraea sp.]